MHSTEKDDKGKISPNKDVLTPYGDKSWNNNNAEDEEREVSAEDMYKTPRIPGTSGVEC